MCLDVHLYLSVFLDLQAKKLAEVGAPKLAPAQGPTSSWIQH